MLRRVLLAASASPKLRQLIVTAPQTRAIVDSYVAGESADDAVRVTRMLRASGLLVTLDYLGEETGDAQRAAATAAQYVHLLGKLGAEGLTEDGAVEVSVKPTALGLPAWPDVPRGESWKEGVLRRIGWAHATPADVALAWRRILRSVTSYADLEPELLGRVEELIDFVTEPDAG